MMDRAKAHKGNIANCNNCPFESTPTYDVWDRRWWYSCTHPEKITPYMHTDIYDQRDKPKTCPLPKRPTTHLNAVKILRV